VIISQWLVGRSNNQETCVNCVCPNVEGYPSIRNQSSTINMWRCGWRSYVRKKKCYREMWCGAWRSLNLAGMQKLRMDVVLWARVSTNFFKPKQKEKKKKKTRTRKKTQRKRIKISKHQKPIRFIQRQMRIQVNNRQTSNLLPKATDLICKRVHTSRMPSSSGAHIRPEKHRPSTYTRT